MDTDRCEDCAHSKAHPTMVNWLLCSEKPAYVYLSAPLAVCTFEPTRFVQKRANPDVMKAAAS